MAKKHILKKQKIIFKKEYILWAIILILIILQGVSAWHIVKLREYAEDHSNLSMRFLLRNAEEDRYKYPVINVTENKVYIPEARIYLPLNEASRDMRYNYSKSWGVNIPTRLVFSTSSVIGRQSGSQFASCDQMVTLSNKSGAERHGSIISTIQPTKDGLTDISAYSYEPCWDQEQYAAAQRNLVEVVKAAQNY